MPSAIRQEVSSRPAGFPFELGPAITDAVWDDGELAVTGSEGLTLNDPSTTPWTVTYDGVPQPITSVMQIATFIFLQTPSGSPPAEILLSYSGGGYVTGDTTGLALQAVTDFLVEFA